MHCLSVQIINIKSLDIYGTSREKQSDILCSWFVEEDKKKYIKKKSTQTHARDN